MLEEEYYEERIKKFLKIGAVLIFISVLIFVLVKVFILKPTPEVPTPSSTPAEEVAIRYFELERERKKEEAEEYLAPYFSQVRILGGVYENLHSSFWIQTEKKEGPLPKYEIKESKVRGSDANITLEITTNRMEDSLFFNFRLPKEIVFKIVLWKIDNNWKIIEIDSPDLILESKLGEQIEIKENVFVKAIKIEDSTLEVEYENESAELVSFYSNSDWKIVDDNGKIYSPLPPPDFEVKQPVLPDIELSPSEEKKVSLRFEIPEDILLKEIVFRNIDKKIIFKIE